MAMKRRIFLRDALMVTSALSISTAALLSSCSGSPNEITKPLLDDFLSEEDITNIVNEHLRNNKKPDKAELESNNNVSDLIETDFINDNIIICDGWVLSQTELDYLIQKTIIQDQCIKL